jgi:hypothetical protein
LRLKGIITRCGQSTAYYLNADGRIAWKATPGMLARLADAEQEVIDDLEG